jgi:hypothetical protein
MRNSRSDLLALTAEAREQLRADLLALLEDERDRPVPRPDRVVAVEREDLRLLLLELYALRRLVTRYGGVDGGVREVIPAGTAAATDRVAHAAGLR